MQRAALAKAPSGLVPNSELPAAATGRSENKSGKENHDQGTLAKQPSFRAKKDQRGKDGKAEKKFGQRISSAQARAVLVSLLRAPSQGQMETEF
jgi:hypothetical protein